MNTLTGKVSLVTGAASGIGRAVALAYTREGARVVVSDVDDRGGQETVQLIRQAGGEAVFFHTDVSDPAACQALVDFTLQTYNRLDIACNNAGIGGESNPAGAYSPEGWDQVIKINLSGVFYCLRYEIPAMLQNGGGAIVNMASILGQVGFAGAPAYVAAKHGVLGLTKVAALEYAQQGIRVNAVGPAFIQTPMIAALESDPELNAMLIGRHPIGRLGKPEEVAELVLWLSSDKASFVTGSYYPVDGGYLAQ
jgi:NAD(P)-dependent dehydrogenase (short-subunit alcohol dehydrogenase family)